MNQVAIFGVGGFGRGVMPLARAQWLASGIINHIVFVDDNLSSTIVNGYPVLSYADWLNQSADSRYINIAVADGIVRRKLVERCQMNGVDFFEVRAASVVQMDNVELGEGGILCPFVTLTSNIRIGKFFHANLYSYVEHDCVIGDYVTFGPSVRCNGNVVIEDHVYVGAGAIIKQGQPGKPLIIGSGSIVGMGAVVTKNVPPNVTVVGNPARPITRI
jgi:sugar O-acyltransferase (sialic acid O-acetyltransferase NeuD family)